MFKRKAPTETKTVLVVDSDLPLRTLLVNRLTASGIKALGIPQSHLALDSIVKYRPQLVVLELDLPVPDGFTILTMLRAHPSPYCQKVPVLVYTNLWSNLHRQQAALHRPAGFLVKAETSLEQVQEAINKLL